MYEHIVKYTKTIKRCKLICFMFIHIKNIFIQCTAKKTLTGYMTRNFIRWISPVGEKSVPYKPYCIPNKVSISVYIFYFWGYFLLYAQIFRPSVQEPIPDL